jgi:calcium-dependent protein kinase
MGNLLCDCVQREEEKENQKEEELNSNISSSEVSESPISEIENHRLISTESIKIDKKLLIGKAEGDIREKYNIGKKLGEGSYGEVYLSIDKKTNKKVAIKVLPKHKSHIDEFNSEIINEIDILKNLEHQNIVKIYEFYEGKKNFYIVTEYCNEGNLKKTIDKKEFITEIEAAAIMFQLFSAIAYCNQNKIMHRDLKAENIMLNDKTLYGLPYVKIIDFGTAKIYENEFENIVIGTLYYMAPEVLNKKYTNKCDMWSLGVILYYLFTKRLPFKAKNKPQLSYYIQNCKYNINLGPLKHASDELKDLIKRLFVVNIDDRLSVNDALNHIWFKKLQIKEKLSELSTEQINECLINIKKYKPEKVLQQASIAFLIHNFSHYEGIKIANSLYLKIDHNNNGVIEKNEFIKELTNLFKEQNEEIKEEYILELFDIIDADKSGYIEHEEFIRAAANKNNLLKESILKNCFEYFDKDKNGEITVDEIKTTFKDYKEKLTDEEFISVIKECDLNQNGVIDYDEFKTVMATILI